MDSLIKIAINNRNELNENFDFTNSTMGIKKRASSSPGANIEDLPIESKKSTWQLVEENSKSYMTKTYKMLSEKHLIYFLHKTIKYSSKIYHHPTIIINNLNVKIVTYTHDINDITELDIDLTKNLDFIYSEIKPIKESLI